MILLIILILIVLILTTVVVLSASAIGSAAILIFGDVIVCIGFLVWLIKKLVTKDWLKKGLSLRTWALSFYTRKKHIHLWEKQ